MRFPGLKKKDIEELQQQIPSRDVIAEKAGQPVHHGRIEDLENLYVPWLRRRRRRR